MHENDYVTNCCAFSFCIIPNLYGGLVTNLFVLYLDEATQEVAVTSPQPSDVQRPDSPDAVLDPSSQEQERERRRPEVLDEDLNDDDVSVDDRLDVASLGDGSDDDIIKSEDEDDYAGSPFARGVTIPPGNPPTDNIQEHVVSRSALFDDQIGSLIFTNQVRLSFRLN